MEGGGLYGLGGILWRAGIINAEKLTIFPSGYLTYDWEMNWYNTQVHTSFLTKNKLICSVSDIYNLSSHSLIAWLIIPHNLKIAAPRMDMLQLSAECILMVTGMRSFPDIPVSSMSLRSAKQLWHPLSAITSITWWKRAEIQSTHSLPSLQQMSQLLVWSSIIDMVTCVVGQMLYGQLT